jgi:uncharacterized damage-inducible protein DinB
MKNRKVSGVAFVCLMASSALAQDGAAPTSGFRAEFLNQFAAQEKEVISLASQIPAEKYSWRPAEGVRSIGEVYLHIAAANFAIPRSIGTPPPEGFKGQGYDTSIKDKDKIIDAVKQSFAHVRKAVLSMSDADLDKKGGQNNATYRNTMLFISRHLGEHLGQSIAYARMNNIVPIWTEEAQKKKSSD